MQPILSAGDKVGIISCSDGIKLEEKQYVEKIVDSLKAMGLQVKISKCLYRNKLQFAGTGKERAFELMTFFKDDEIKAIFDISGGDAANQVLSYLDFDVIKKYQKPYFGMSDLTVILNSLHSSIGLKAYHYTAYNLARKNSENQNKLFKASFINGQNDIFEFKYNWLRGNKIDGTVIGGNIRCFLKLAGTKFFPSPKGKVLLLEGLNGNVSTISSLIEQMYIIGYFKELSGIILGVFTEVQKEGNFEALKDIILERTEEWNIPIVKTEEIGHGSNSKCIIIGDKIRLNTDLMEGVKI